MSNLRFSRREFLAASATLSAMSLAMPASASPRGKVDIGEPAKVSDEVIQFALISETHAVSAKLTENEFVCGRQAGFLMTNEALEVCVDHLQALQPHLEFVIHAGNLLHGLPLMSAGDYFARDTALDSVDAELKRLRKPFYMAVGPYDYGELSENRELAHDILRAKLNIEPFAAFEHKGWTFVMLNSNFSLAGGLGMEQLRWFESLLERSENVVVTMHANPSALDGRERDALGEIVARYRAKITQIFCSSWAHLPQYEFFGVPVQAVSEQRHDADSLLVVRLDRKSGALSFLNEWTLT